MLSLALRVEVGQEGSFLFFSSFSKDTLSLILERERKGEREREKHRCEGEVSISCLLVCAPAGDRTRNLGMCPDHESNQKYDLSVYGKALQPTEQHQPGQFFFTF